MHIAAKSLHLWRKQFIPEMGANQNVQSVQWVCMLLKMLFGDGATTTKNLPQYRIEK